MTWCVDDILQAEINLICARCKTELWKVRNGNQGLNVRAARLAIAEHLWRSGWLEEDIADFLFVDDRYIDHMIEKLQEDYAKQKAEASNATLWGKVLDFVGRGK